MPTIATLIFCHLSVVNARSHVNVIMPVNDNTTNRITAVVPDLTLCTLQLSKVSM